MAGSPNSWIFDDDNGIYGGCHHVWGYFTLVFQWGVCNNPPLCKISRLSATIEYTYYFGLGDGSAGGL